jgi:hypothetical protein
MPYDIEKNSRWPSPHHNFVPEYQQSGIPFAITYTAVGDTWQQLDFPAVTRWIHIYTTQDIRINFNDDITKVGSAIAHTDNTNFVAVIPAGQSIRFELKCKNINFRRSGNQDAQISIIAGLTNVHPSNLPDQTYANGFPVNTAAVN